MFYLVKNYSNTQPADVVFKSQAIVAAGGPLEDPVWQVHEPLLRKALNARHKLQSALFPLTTSVDGMEPQDVTVYQLLQVNFCVNLIYHNLLSLTIICRSGSEYILSSREAQTLRGIIVLL